MHDSMTMAWELHMPWGKKGGSVGYTLIEIWHRDPEKGGDEDSCDHRNRKGPMKPHEQRLADALYRLGSYTGNDPFYSAHKEEVEELTAAKWGWLNVARHRRVRVPWVLHVHHWDFRFMPLVEWRRRRERCAECGVRMGRSIRYGTWGGDKVTHWECRNRREASRG